MSVQETRPEENGTEPQEAKPQTPTLSELLYEAISENNLDDARAALERGADPNGEDECFSTDGVFQLAETKEMITLLYDHGAKVHKLHMKEPARSLLVGLSGADDEDDILARLTREQYDAGSALRFGTANPHKMDVAFWNVMVEARCWAYSARQKFRREGEGAFGTAPVWCFDRFGHSLTKLPDGGFVQIAGEHEDFYDPDFAIYNDVVVHHADSTAANPKFDIYGYPEDVFPPTDFHSATYVPSQNAIYIIGNNGYSTEVDVKQRNEGVTPVYRLEVGTWKIQKMETTGDAPGWIYKHQASLEGQDIVVGPDLDEYLSDSTSYKRAQRYKVVEDGEAELVEIQ
ncbi:hypothetical protein BU24DRAFT_407801 [Aaosphaeria arxii CBS 175.79]|uniref:Ankyrin n=1 Tax=Aaosphaeria arxii CBS 175.79 TaxID=1450172 RepID=A0A6A5XXZ8_9PLEO|nr:uncharacterized protein BU24DRAFT_407801 [Aaosphaeria arxii CBS 175.79]KAF2017829.1 hypothetical protein BU24DRAFT_407801 [Aaosphaeria arxii CBS 175.79]